MSSYFYADRTDSKGNRLLTSYPNAKSAEKYGGADADVTNTLYRADFDADKTKLRISEKGNGAVVRSFMQNSSEPQSHNVGDGQFQLWGKIGGVWSQTDFSFDAYGTANTMMKTMISAFQAMLVLDAGGAPAPRSNYVPRGFDDL